MQKPIKEINIKIIFIIILVLLLTLASYGYVFKYMPVQKEKIKIIEYKKDFYNSIFCEYNCPLKMQEYNNKTKLLPELDCVKNCTKDFKEKNNHTKFSSADLNQDNLIKDIDNSIKNCKKQSLNSTSMSINNSLLFSCSIQTLESLKEKYEYLNN